LPGSGCQKPCPRCSTSHVALPALHACAYAHPSAAPSLRAEPGARDREPWAAWAGGCHAPPDHPARAQARFARTRRGSAAPGAPTPAPAPRPRARNPAYLPLASHRCSSQLLAAVHRREATIGMRPRRAQVRGRRFQRFVFFLLCAFADWTPKMCVPWPSAVPCVPRRATCEDAHYWRLPSEGVGDATGFEPQQRGAFAACLGFGGALRQRQAAAAETCQRPCLCLVRVMRFAPYICLAIRAGCPPLMW
jgi:hypothetical protein